MMEDERFNRIKCDAKFRRIPKKSQKVKIDKRFQSMFKDAKFQESSTVDERGRPIEHSSTKDLKRYYHLSSSEESSSEDEDESKLKNQDQEVLEKTNITDKKISKDVKKKLKNLKVDYARGEQTLLSESSSDDEESEIESEEEDTVEHKWGELDADAETTEDVTNRLAVCNMDWDKIRAVDIMVLLNSFLPPGGVIKSVNIYVSDFGKKRLAEEDISGPPELTESKLDNSDYETEDGSKYHMEKLRQYQLNRLKYYYAVITFNNENVANKVYTECDGMEYESSAVRLDLRIIPNGMEFDDDPKDTCEQIPSKYQPRYFTTTALQQAKVNLTWDETNPDRIDLTEKINSGKFDDLDEDQLKNFIALSEDESEEEDFQFGGDDPVAKYSALLRDIENKEKQKEDEDIELEATWDIGLEEKSKELVEKKMAEREEKTPFQQYLDKRKEKKKEKKKHLKKQTDSDDEDSDIPSDIDMNDPYFAEEFDKPEFSKKKKTKLKSKEAESRKGETNQNEDELHLLLADEHTNDKKHFSLKKLQQQEEGNKQSKKNKKKRKNKKPEMTESDGFKVDVDDPRFSAVFSSHLYSIDPSSPSYKKTEGMEILIKEKLKRSAETDHAVVSKRSKLEHDTQKNTELGVLVKNLKRKTKAMMKNK